MAADNMTVLQFTVEKMIPTRKPGPSTKALLRIVNEITLEWPQLPRIDKLTEHSIKEQYAHCKRKSRALLTVLRYAMECGAVATDPRYKHWPALAASQASTDALDPGKPGTLWHLCVTEYFPRNPRITTTHTKVQYKYGIQNLSDSLGHTATIKDLTDDNVAAMMVYLREQGLATPTINGRRGVIHSLWVWLAKRGKVDAWPTTQELVEPQRTPRGWTKSEMNELFNAAALITGKRRDVPKWLYWQCLISLIWNTGERISAVLNCRWENLDTKTRWLLVPAEIRKGKKKDRSYQIGPETMELLAMMRKHSPEYLIPRIYNEAYIWQAYEGLLKLAGLPTDRRSKFHRLRRSVASHFRAAGGDAQELLGHTSAATTEGYIDPRIHTPPQPSERLFQLRVVSN